ncbi:MAG: hypothetical protein FWG75_00845 [Cystobacterineae bacterium]|nr:hypothetical protein [Cystobacterineae bacterium]
MHTFPPALFAKRFLSACLLGACLATFVSPSPAPALPKKAPEAKENFELYEGMDALLPLTYLYTDSKGHYLVLVLRLNLEMEANGLNGYSPRDFFWGDGNVFFRQWISMSDVKYKEPNKIQEASGIFPDTSLYYQFHFWEPRIKGVTKIERSEKDGLHVVCGQGDEAPLKPVPHEEAKAILEKAKFYEQRFMRKPHLLARDDQGTYYYIDKSTRKDEKDFQIFIGKEGQLKRAKLKNIVQDSEGEIFSTPNGSLRIIIAKSKEVLWVRGEKKQVLTNVPIQNNQFLIFSNLGVYARQKLGTPCDEL